MPLVCIGINEPTRGDPFSIYILMDKFPGSDYTKVGAIFNRLTLKESVTKGISLEIGCENAA